MDEVLKFFKDNPTYFLATVDQNGNPQVRPFGTMAKYEGKLYIQTGNVKNVFKEIMAHPRVAICGFDGQHWVRIDADAIQDDRVEARKAVLDEYPELQSMYAPDDGNCEVLYLENATATFCSFTEEPRTVAF